MLIRVQKVYRLPIHHWGAAPCRQNHQSKVRITAKPAISDSPDDIAPPPNMKKAHSIGRTERI